MSTWERFVDWFGFDPHGHAHGEHDHDGGHGHTHGVIDATIATTDRGIWAIKWSFGILAITALLQIGVVVVSGSVALLADTIHNIGDATTAIPLWIAFVLARRKPTRTFTYGLGRVEDLAGIIIILIILFSAIVAGYQAIDRLIHPQTVSHLGWLTAAGIVGFLGNEAVAVFRVRVGREINSAALIADGYHARTDGLTSLAVVVGALGVGVGFPLADPLVGLLITIAIFDIVWQSARSVLTRMLDGVEPGVIDEIHHAAEHIPGVRVANAKARWIGHQLHADVEIIVDDELSVASANGVASTLRQELHAHLPALRTVNITFDPSDIGTGPTREMPTGAHYYAPEPFRFSGELAEGVLEIIDTPQGERLRLSVARQAPGLSATVSIERPGGLPEALRLQAASNDHHALQSSVAPSAPHEFTAELLLTAGERQESLPFRMIEPAGHYH